MKMNYLFNMILSMNNNNNNNNNNIFICYI